MNKKSFIVIVILLIAIILGLCVFIAYDKNLFGIKGESKIEKNNVAEKKEEDNTNKAVDSGNENKLVTISLDESKSLNSDTEKLSYRVTTNYTMNGIYVNCNSNTCMISINWDFVNKDYFNLNSEKSGNEDIKIENISGKIVDVFTDSMGQSASCSTVLILLDDGSVEYIPLFYALKNNNIKSYGKIDGVTNVTKFLSVGVSPKSPGGGYHSIVALRSDGSFYDLTENLASLQYYSEG